MIYSASMINFTSVLQEQYGISLIYNVNIKNLNYYTENISKDIAEIIKIVMHF